MTQYMDDFDRRLSREIKESGQQIETPNREEVWAEIEKRIREPRRKMSAFKKAVIAAAVLVFLGTGTLATSKYASADFVLVKVMRTFWNNIASISGVVQTTSEALPRGATEETGVAEEKRLIPLKEAQRLLDYDIILPQDIPEGFKLAGVYVRRGDQMSPVKLYFEHTGGKGNLTIEEKPLTRASAFSHNIRINDAEIKEVDIGGSSATLIYFKNMESRQLMGQTPAMYYTIEGPVTEEEILRIGRSM